MNDWAHYRGSCLGLIIIQLQVKKKNSSDLIEFKFLIGSTAGGNETNCFFEQRERRKKPRSIYLSFMSYHRKCCTRFLSWVSQYNKRSEFNIERLRLSLVYLSVMICLTLTNWADSLLFCLYHLIMLPLLIGLGDKMISTEGSIKIYVDNDDMLWTFLLNMAQ